MTARTVRLVERRAREVRLPPADARFLLAAARGVIDVVPTFRPDRYRLTPRGYVGLLRGPSVRFEIGSKLPRANLFDLLGLPDRPAGLDEPTSDLVAALAHTLADRLRELTAAGLVAGYREADHDSAFLRGRLRTAEQVRDAAARAFPDRFHVSENLFDLDTPWNRIPQFAASELLSRFDLPPAARSDLLAAVQPLDTVTLGPVSPGDWDTSHREPRAAGYNAVLALSRLILDGLSAADAAGSPGPALLLDLGRAFERHLERLAAEAFAGRAGWAVEPQPLFPLGPVELQPDLVVRRRGAVRAVFDAKWKRPGPDPADLHQVLAYATLTGAERVALVYPGRRPGRWSLAVPGRRVTVTLLRVPVVGPVAACRRVSGRTLRSVLR